MFYLLTYHIMKGFGFLFVGIAIVLLANRSNRANAKMCLSMYKQLDKMTVEATMERLQLENLYFKACVK